MQASANAASPIDQDDAEIGFLIAESRYQHYQASRQTVAGR
jgi:hypothetical protein